MAHCPDLNNLSKKKQHDLLVDAVGENFAHTIWDRNNGNFVNKTYNGESSKLFYNILNEVDDYKEAIRLKSRIYTKDIYNKWKFTDIEPEWSKELQSTLTQSRLQYNNLVEDPESLDQVNYRLFIDSKTIHCEGICNITARNNYEFLLENGLDPYWNQHSGSGIAVTVKSPMNEDWNITHYVSAVAINGALYIYDMPQDEFLDADITKTGSKESIKIKQAYTPRLIPLSVEGIKNNYRLSTEEAALFIKNVLTSDITSVNSVEGVGYNNMVEYLQSKIDNPEEYVTALLSQIEEATPIFFKEGLTLDNLHEVEKIRHEDGYDLDFRVAAAREIFNSLDRGFADKDFNKIVNFVRNKLKLKVRQYLPKKEDHTELSNYKEVVRNILSKSSLRYIDFTNINTTKETLKNYLNSDYFVQDIWEDYFTSYSNKTQLDKEYKRFTESKRIMEEYLKHARVVGMEAAKKRYKGSQLFLINDFTIFNQRILNKVKTEQKKISTLYALLKRMPKFLGYRVEKDDIKMKLIKTNSKLNKAKTLLYYLEINDFNTDELLNVIDSELQRRREYFEKIEPQYSRESSAKSITLKKALKQAEILKRALPFIEEVRLNEDLDAIAQVEPGGKIITINPTKLREDTMGHEFGHVLIDLMGGMGNKFIREGREQLVGSPIEKQVAKNYPDFRGTEAFDKEVLATAIGMEVADTFREEEDRTKRSKFANWLLNFFRALKRMFGIERNNARELAKKMVEGKKINLKKFQPTLSTYIQQSKSIASSKSGEDIIEAVENISKQFTKPSEKTNNAYIFNPTGDPFKRVSHVLAKWKLSITEEVASKSDAIKFQNRVGTVVHHIAEMVLRGEKNIKSNDPTVKISDAAIRKVKQIVDDTFKDYYITSETIVGSVPTRMAGTADVFAVHKETGEQFIFDFKTKRMYKKNWRTGKIEYYGFSKYTKPFRGEKYSQAEKNGAQLSLYQKMFENSLGKEVINIKGRNIVQLVTDAEETEDGTITIKDVELDRNSQSKGVFPLRYYPIVDKIYAKEKEIEKALHPEEDITDEEVEERKDEFDIMELEEGILKPIEQLRESAINLVVSRVNRDRARGRVASSVGILSEVLYSLSDENLDPQEALLDFIENSIISINASYKNYLQQLKLRTEGKEEAFPISMIQRWFTIYSAYNILDDIMVALQDGEFDEAVKEAKNSDLAKKGIEGIKTILQTSIYKKNKLRDVYKTIGIEVTAKDLAPMYTGYIEQKKEGARKTWIEKHLDQKDQYTTKEWFRSMNEYAETYYTQNKDKLLRETEVFLKAEMIKASRGDIGLVERWVYSAINSPDPVVAAMLKKFSLNFHYVRHESLAYRDKMLDILEDLEALRGYTTSDDPADTYSFMLEHDSDNNATGYVLSNLSSSYNETYNKVKEDAKDLPFEEREKVISKWLNENAPLNNVAYNEALSKHIDELVEKGEMTEEQVKLFWAYTKRRTKKGLLAVLEDYQLAENIDTWERYNVDKFREPIAKWKSKEWSKLEAILQDKNDPRTRFYNLIVETIEKRDAVLTKKDQLGFQLPFMHKTGRERMISGHSMKSIFKYKISKYFTYLEDDATRNRNVLTDENDNPLQSLPTFFKRNEETFNVADQSFDLGTLYYLWNKMAYNFEVMSELLPQMEEVKSILDTREYAVKDSAGRLLTKSMDLLGVKNISRKNTATNLAAQYDDYLNALVYGNMEMYEDELNVFGFRIDIAKTWNTLGKYTAYNLLGLNLLQGVNNLTYGEVQNTIEAHAGEHYDVKGLIKSSKYYWERIGGVLGDVGERRPISLLGQLIETFDVLSDPEDTEMRKNTKYSQMMKSNTLFFMSHAGEHYMQSRVFLAMLDRKPAYDKNGKYLGSLLDMYTQGENGKLKLKDEVDLAKSNWSKDQQIIFGEKVKFVLAGLHGEFSKLGWLSIQKTSLGRLGLMFRKYLVPGVVRRFGGVRHNERLGSITSGDYRTALKFWGRFVKDWYKLGVDVAKTNYSKMLPREYYNVQRTIAEAGFAVFFVVLSTALVALGSAIPPDEKDSLQAMALNILTYSALRTSKELQFYYVWNPFPALSILKSPAAAVSTIESIGNVASQLLYGPFDEYKRKDSPYKYKITKKIIKALPYTRQVHNVVNAEDLINMMSWK